MTIYEINPRLDARWNELLNAHPGASIFHTAAWLEALCRTYGYESMAFTTARPTEELRNAVVFCPIKSRLIGNRLVSLPFTDHCEPLVGSPEELNFLLVRLVTGREYKRWKYLEIRPADCNLNSTGEPTGFRPSKAFVLHRLDLGPSWEALFRNFHKDSIQRRIRKAEREGVEYESGRSEELLAKYYRLALLTRRRHQVPPQPIEWYRNLLTCMGDAIEIHVASKEGREIASIITLRFKDTVVYKYGCSDTNYNHLGAGPLLMFKAIRAAKLGGAREFDFGRSDCNNEGLITYKDRWGSLRTPLTYWRFPSPTRVSVGDGVGLKFAKFVFGHMPGPLLKLAGKLVYRFAG